MIRLEPAECCNTRDECIHSTQSGGRLFIGGKDNALDKKWLHSMNIARIVNVSTNIECYFKEEFMYLRIPCKDEITTSISDYFEEAVVFIDQAMRSGRGVLVHCEQGMSRSCTIILAYLMQCQGLPLLSALSILQERHHLTSPNPGFMEQLLSYEWDIFSDVSLDIAVYRENRFSSACELELSETTSREDSEGKRSRQCSRAYPPPIFERNVSGSSSSDPCSSSYDDYGSDYAESLRGGEHSSILKEDCEDSSSRENVMPPVSTRARDRKNFW